MKVEFRQVGKEFTNGSSSTKVLDDVSLRIQEGELVCLLGESGCGKSTLLHMIAGFQFPSSGEVLVDSALVGGPSHTRGVVFQSPALFPWLTVRDNVQLGPRIRKLKNQSSAVVDKTISLVGLEGFENFYAGQLSGGMAQRVAIARVLVNSPQIVLLDEPFGALDAFTRIRMQQELVRLWELEKFTAIFVTHDIDEAVTLATRIVLLTPRPARVARVFNIGLSRPRDLSSPEFYRVRSMIAKEFMNLVAASGRRPTHLGSPIRTNQDQ